MTEEQKVEQITKEPEQEKVEKIKDPKKVAAGKRLAASNKKARKEVMEANKQQDEESNSSGWFPTSVMDMNFSTVVGLVGIGLTATDLYFRYRKPTLVSTNVVEEKKKSPAVKE